ncbi:MAG: LamG-like jellyroll fold domain-containing protein, partial [Planctomycetota bacterium]
MFRRLIRLVSLALVLGVAGSAQAILVGHWKLDGNAADSSVSGLDGEITGSPNWVDGKVGLAMEIDGDDWIEIPGTSQNDGFPSVEGEVTWAVWFKTSNAGVLNTVMAVGPAGAAHVQGNRSINVEAAGDIMIRAHSVGALTTPRSVATVADGEWHHVAVTIAFETDGDNDTMKVYIDGDLSQGYETTDININQHSGPGADFIVTLGARGTTPFVGMIDDARVYDHVLAEEEILAAMAGGGGGFPLALLPNPQDGAMLEATWANLSWRAGTWAVSHDLYFGTSFDDVNDGAEGTFAGNLGVTTQVVGFFGFPAPDGLQPGTTYYWRVDEVNDANAASPWKGDVWSFWIPPRTAYNGSPAEGAMNVLQDATLSWTPGMGASLHQVYFGDNFNDVNGASGAVLQTDSTYTLSALEVEKTYYWRVDEFDSAGTTHRGDVWSFTTLPDIAITDPDLVAWWTFDEGQGTTAIDWSGHGNHATLFGSEWTAAALGDTGLSIGDYGAIRNLSYDANDLTEVTVTAWVRTTSSADQYIVSFDRNEYYRLEINGSGAGPGQVGWDVMTSSGQVDYGSISRVDDGAWHHITSVYDKGLLTIYIDGAAEPSATGGPTYGSGNTRFGFIGANSEAGAFNSPTPGGSPVAGEVDDIRIYHRALTQEEIAMVMRGDPKLAGSPTPDRDVIVDIRDISSLSWSA